MTKPHSKRKSAQVPTEAELAAWLKSCPPDALAAARELLAKALAVLLAMTVGSAFAEDTDAQLEPGDFNSDRPVFTCETAFHCTISVEIEGEDPRTERLWHGDRIPDPANQDHNDVVEIVPVRGRFEEVERRHYEGGSRDVVKTHICHGGGQPCNAEITSSEPPYDRGVREERERMRYQHGYRSGYREVCLSLFVLKSNTREDCLATLPDLDDINDPDS